MNKRYSRASAEAQQAVEELRSSDARSAPEVAPQEKARGEGTDHVL